MDRAASFVAKGRHWIDPRRATGWQIGCDRRDRGEEHRHGDVGRRTDWLYVIQHSLDIARQCNRAHQSNADADTSKEQTLTQHYSEDISAPGAQCRSDAKFTSTLLDGIGEDAVDADSAQQHC